MPASLTRHLSIALDLSSFALITAPNSSDKVRDIFNSLGLRAGHHKNPRISYQAIEMYRFRFARVCVPLSGPAFLLASPFEDTPDACGVFPCGLGDSEFIFQCRFCSSQRQYLDCMPLLRARNGESLSKFPGRFSSECGDGIKFFRGLCLSSAIT